MAAAMLNSTLEPKEVSRWRFSELMDYSAPKRRGQIPQSAAEVIAAYEPALEGAQCLAAQYAAEVVISKADSDARRDMQSRAQKQAHHAVKLRESYSYLLAQSIWWSKVEATEAESKARHDAYAAAVDAHRAEQRAFAEIQADAAIAALPSLPAATAERLRTLIAIAINKASTYKEKGDYFARKRDAAPRRVMRGVPLVRVGCLPSPPLPPSNYAFHWHAF